MSQSESCAAGRSVWIISPVWDMLFLVGAPAAIVPAVWLLSREVFTPEQISLAVIAFASMGHHLPGFMRAYGDRALFARFKWRLLLLPPLLFALALLFSPPPSLAARLSLPWEHLHGLELLLLLWGTWHGLMQTYGFMRIYDLKRGIDDAWNARLDHWLCLGIFGSGMVLSDSRLFGVLEVLWQSGVPTFSTHWLPALRWGVGGATMLVAAAYVANLLLRSGRVGGVSWIKLLLALSTGGLYYISGRITTSLLIGIAMFEIFHAVQYFAIVWVYNRRLFQRVGERFGALGFLFRDRWSMLLMYLGAIAAYSAMRYVIGDSAGGAVSVESLDARKLLLAFFTTSTFLHFYYDGFIWRVRETSTRDNLDIEPAGAVREMFVPALAHAAKWSVFFALTSGLLWLEYRRGPKTEEQQRAMMASLAAWTPELPELQTHLVREALRAGDADAALAAARKALALRPRAHFAHADLGHALLEAGELDDAREAFEQAIALAPRKWQYYGALAATQQRLGQDEAAMASCRTALEIEPAAVEIHRDYAALLAKQDNWQQAVGHYEQALRLAPDSWEVFRELVQALAAFGQHDAALTRARRAVAGAPRAPAARLLLAAVCNDTGRPQEAIEAIEQAMDLGLHDGEVYYQLGRAMLALENLPAARQTLLRAVQLDPQHAKAHFQLGNVLSATGRDAEAEAAYARCLQIAPDFVDARSNLGSLLFKQGRIEKAEVAFRQALHLAPRHAAAHYNLGLLLLKQGRRQEARSHVQQAQQLGQRASPEVLAELGLEER